jgi:threonine/homoserine/homoserine lactone efflux protein
MGLLIFIVALGLGHLVIGHAFVLQILNWAGVAFLLWLAWKIAGADPSNRSQGGKPVGFVQAALFQWINPKSWIASTGAVGAYLQPGEGSALLQSVSFAALFVLATFPSGFLWLAFGASMQRFMANATAARAFNVVMGVLACDLGDPQSVVAASPGPPHGPLARQACAACLKLAASVA